MRIKKARRRTFDVTYIVVSEENIDRAATWCNGAIGGEGEDRFIRITDKNAINTRQTKAFIGDYVVNYRTSFKSFSKKAFHKAFEDLNGDLPFDEVLEHAKPPAEHARSAKDGKFVTAEFAESHPDETVVEKVIYEPGTENIKNAQEQFAKSFSDIPTEDLGGL